MILKKSSGVTATEEWLAQLCEQTFFGLWSYPNPCKDDGDELCDLLAVYENHIFVFFDRENNSLGRSDVEQDVSWRRWKKKSIDAQIKTAIGAERYFKSGRSIYIDSSQQSLLTLTADRESMHVHKIIVAHGAKEACLRSSASNIYGSLGIYYGDGNPPEDTPFTIHLGRRDLVHVLDAVNLPIVLRELNTPSDFTAYVSEKEQAIAKYDGLSYCGEEDLLAHYLFNYNPKTRKHFIGRLDSKYTFVGVGEGEWKSFIEHEIYQTRQAANRGSYLWDEIIATTSRNAISGKLLGPHSPLEGRSAVHEMAKEPRHFRRALSNQMRQAISEFPISDEPFVRNVSFMPSHNPERGYVFLQLKCEFDTGDYDKDYRPKRSEMLLIACGAARNNFPHLRIVIGIAIDAPKYSNVKGDDQLLLDCTTWTNEEEEYFRSMNADLQFFETKSMVRREEHLAEFPNRDKPVNTQILDRKIGRNERCPCGSGLKYKKCCIA